MEAQIPDCGRGSGIARDRYGLCAFLEESSDCPKDKLPDFFCCFCAVGSVGGVPEKEKIFRWHELDHFLKYTDATNTRIHYSYKIFI